MKGSDQLEDSLNTSFNIDSNSCLAEIAIKALAAPADMGFSGRLVYELAVQLLEARLELQRVSDSCEAADQLAEAEISDLHEEVLFAAEWAKRLLESQRGSSSA